MRVMHHSDRGHGFWEEVVLHDPSTGERIQDLTYEQALGVARSLPHISGPNGPVAGSRIDGLPDGFYAHLSDEQRDAHLAASDRWYISEQAGRAYLLDHDSPTDWDDMCAVARGVRRQ